MPTMELCVPGGWLQNFSANLVARCSSNLALAMSWVAFGEGAPNVHWSKNTRLAFVFLISLTMSSCVDMSTCSALPSIANL
eukprot:273432-Pleurochrysis_carterae.AAC.1